MDLNPGDPYRLVFVTFGSSDAASSDIADYNAFVTAAANSVAELVSVFLPQKLLRRTVTSAV